MHVTEKSGKFSWLPIQYEVLGKDEFAGAVDRPPDEPDHQHLQPGALQQLHLVMKAELQETYKNTHKVHFNKLFCEQIKVINSVRRELHFLEFWTAVSKGYQLFD